MRKILFCTLPILVLSSMTRAQDRTIALTATTQYLVAQEMDGQNCKSVQCSLAFEKAAAPNAGGTAYDARSGIVWISNGLVLAAYNSPDGTSLACKQACPAIKIPQPPVITAASYCTGLAFLEAGTLTTSGGLGPYGRLYILYSSNYIGVVDVKGCSLGTVTFCSIANSIGTANITGGLACDDLNRRLFVGTFDAAAGALCYVFDADKVCSVICKFQVTVSRGACGINTVPLKALTGLAYNGCSQMLYVTDGAQTIWGLVKVSSAGCTFTHRACCPVQVEPYTGIALLPAPPQHLGKPCWRPSCNNCLPQIGTTGDAILGNKLFAVNLNGAPSNTTAYALAIGLGSCSLPGLNLGFCQPVMISLAPPGPVVYLYGTAPIAGTCNRNVSFPLPLPIKPVFCNLTLSFQWLAACQGNPNGHAMTDCMTITLGSL